MDIPISALPAAGPLSGTEQIPLVQGGVTSRAPAAALVGPAGPKGGANLSIVTHTGPTAYAVQLTDDFILGDDSGGGFFANLPSAALWPNKPLIAKYVGAFGSNMVLIPNGTDTFESVGAFTLPGSNTFAQFATVQLYPFNYPLFGAWVWLVLAFQPPV